VIKGCPNIEELHIDLKLYYKEPMAIEYFSELRFKHLKRLSIKWSERDMIPSHGFYLPLVKILSHYLYFLTIVYELNFSTDLQTMSKIGEHPVERWLYDEIFLPPPDTLPSWGYQLARFKAIYNNLFFSLVNIFYLFHFIKFVIYRLEWDLCSFDDYDFSPLLLFMEDLLNSSNSPYFERLVLKVCKKPDFCWSDSSTVNRRGCATSKSLLVPFGWRASKRERYICSPHTLWWDCRSDRSLLCSAKILILL